MKQCRNWIASAALVFAAATVVAGCRNGGPPLIRPAGSAQFQQARAQQFDPFPTNSGGPPLVGTRPREFEFPPAEPVRARWVNIPRQPRVR